VRQTLSRCVRQNKNEMKNKTLQACAVYIVYQSSERLDTASLV
jgi:hypothetical protein